jgi:hypothetical protein
VTPTPREWTLVHAATERDEKGNPVKKERGSYFVGTADSVGLSSVMDQGWQSDDPLETPIATPKNDLGYKADQSWLAPDLSSEGYGVDLSFASILLVSSTEAPAGQPPNTAPPSNPPSVIYKYSILPQAEAYPVAINNKGDIATSFAVYNRNGDQISAPASFDYILELGSRKHRRWQHCRN